MDPVAVNLPPEEINALREQAAQFQATDLLRMLEIVSQLAFRMSRSAMPRFELEAALIKLANMDASVDIAQLLSGQPVAGAVEPKKKIIPAAPEPPASGETPPPQPPQASEFNFADLKEKWRTHLAAITDGNMQVGAFLSFSFILAADEKEIRIGMPRSHQFQYQQLIKPEHLKYLMDFFRKRCGYEGRVSVEAVEDEKSRVHLGAERGDVLKSADKAPARTEMNINEAIRREPILGTLLDEFNGEIR
jgi:DNA polymerase III gamma/tau subunit